MLTIPLLSCRLPALFLLSALLLSGITASLPAAAHCQIPCGIYDDHARIQAMLEHAATIDKAISQISQLAGKSDAQSQNQLVRWVNSKEHHAQLIISTISDYFLTQRVKPTQKDYPERLARHHQVMLSAMKAKQGTESSLSNTLRQDISALAKWYPPHEH